jgi:hypothetical protein
MDPVDPIDDAPGAAGGAAPAVADVPMDVALQWIGFDAQATRDCSELRASMPLMT